MLRSAGRVLLTLAFLGIVVGCGGPPEAEEKKEEKKKEEKSGDAIAIQVAAARRDSLSSIYSTSSTLRADRQATVIARTQGVVRQLLVEEGDLVDENQALAVLEDDEQRIEFERTEAAFEIEQKDFQRSGRLYDDELLSHEDYETARRELDEAKHAFSRAELELNRTRIRAPFAGKILRRHLDMGATVSDGTAVYDLADLQPLYADVSIPERHVSRLAPGQTVRLTADASGEETLATIERIAPSVDPATGTVKVTLAVKGGARLRPGTFVRANIVIETHTNALVVPRSALVAEGRRWHLFRLDPDGEKVSQLEVKLGFEEGDRVEVGDVIGSDELLASGDQVVVVGAPALTDGAGVQVIDTVADGEPAEGAPDGAGS